ncbi:MAG: DUF2892 domain-containing protein [Rudaea sp.]
MESLVHFMNIGVGRGLRFVLGVVLIYVGLAVVSGTLGLILAIVGLVPIAMAAWGHCLLEVAAPKAHRA